MRFNKMAPLLLTLLCLQWCAITVAQTSKPGGMKLNEQEYLEYGSVNVMLAHDFYPESHQANKCRLEAT